MGFRRSSLIGATGCGWMLHRECAGFCAALIGPNRLSPVRVRQLPVVPGRDGHGIADAGADGMERVRRGKGDPFLSMATS